jgi:transposase
MFNNFQTPTPSEAAKTEILRLFQIERDLTEKRRQKILDLDAIRHGVAQEVVDGTTGIEDAAARVAQRHAEVAAAEEAIAIVRQRRVKAIQARYKAEAGEMRAIAARCRQEAVDILKRCEPLLRKLSDLQGLTYSSSILLAQRNSQWTGSYITGAPIEECNPIEATADINAGFLVPRSRELLEQAKGLETKAVALEEREVLFEGSIDRPTLAAVLAEEHFTNPEIVAPPVHLVESWATSVEARIRRDRPELAGREDDGRTSRRYSIKWRDGDLQLGSCSISFLGVNYAAGDPTFTVGSAA